MTSTPDDVLDFVDENEEWAKIEKVMASLDTGLSSEVMYDEDGIRNILEGGSSFCGNTTKQHGNINNGTDNYFTNNSFLAYDRALTEWLVDQGLSRYEHLLISNGFDDLRFMGSEIMTEGDLIEIGMSDDKERNELLTAAQHLKSSSTGATADGPASSFKSVREWLTSLNLSDYFETFVAHGCSEMGDLLNIWDLQLTSIFHISRLGHRNRIMASINSLRTTARSAGCKTQHSKEPLTNGCHDNQDEAPQPKTTQNICLTEYLLQRNNPTHSNSSHIGEVSLFKDYSSLKSNKSGRSSGSSTLRRQDDEEDDEDGSRRGSNVITVEEVLRNCGVIEPNNNTTTTPTSSSSSTTTSCTSTTTSTTSSSTTTSSTTTSSSSSSTTTSCTTPNNKQSTDGIVTNNSSHQFGHSSYSVTYLGSVKLQSIERPDLARKCIEQIRQSPVVSRKVVISVSHRQVIFGDQTTQEILGAHDVSNVFCVCQDMELLEYFAFVTWDVLESVHFCHVFNAVYVTLSTDVVMALGKAFEVAFQLIQQEATKQNERSLSSSSTSPISPTSSTTTIIDTTKATTTQRQNTISEKRSTFV